MFSQHWVIRDSNAVLWINVLPCLSLGICLQPVMLTGPCYIDCELLPQELSKACSWPPQTPAASHCWLCPAGTLQIALCVATTVWWVPSVAISFVLSPLIFHLSQAFSLLNRPQRCFLHLSCSALDAGQRTPWVAVSSLRSKVSPWSIFSWLTPTARPKDEVWRWGGWWGWGSGVMGRSRALRAAALLQSPEENPSYSDFPLRICHLLAYSYKDFIEVCSLLTVEFKYSPHKKKTF